MEKNNNTTNRGQDGVCFGVNSLKVVSLCVFWFIYIECSVMQTIIQFSNFFIHRRQWRHEGVTDWFHPPNLLIVAVYQHPFL